MRCVASSGSHFTTNLKLRARAFLWLLRRKHWRIPLPTSYIILENCIYIPNGFIYSSCINRSILLRRKIHGQHWYRMNLEESGPLLGHPEDLKAGARCSVDLSKHSTESPTATLRDLCWSDRKRCFTQWKCPVNSSIAHNPQDLLIFEDLEEILTMDHPSMQKLETCI